MKQIINRKVYDTKTATRVASDYYWDGWSSQRNGRNTYLYKTKKGNFFAYHTAQWQAIRDAIEAMTPEEAKDLYEQLPEHEQDFETAFGEKPEEA